MSENQNEPGSQNSEPDPIQHSMEPASGDTSVDEPFRMPLDAPQHLRGKTAEEVIEWSDDVSNQVRTFYSQNQQVQTQAAAPPPPAALDSDLILTNPEEYQRQLESRINTQQATNLATAAQPIINAQADTARFMSQHDKKHEETWDRWERDIDMQVTHIPANLRTKALYDQAAKIVRADHVDELIDEKAKNLASAGLGLDTGSTFLGEPSMHNQGNSDVWAKFEKSAVGRNMLKTLGKRKIAEMCEVSGDSLEDYADMVANNRADIDPQRGTIDNYDLRLGD